MLEYIGKPRLSDGHDPDADDALRHHASIVDAWQRRGAEPVGTAMATRACSTTKGRRMPVRRGRGTVIAGPRGIIYTPPTGEERIRSMLDELWSFMRDDAGTHPLVRMAAGHHQFESIHPFADGNGRTGRLINLLYLTERKLTGLPILCHSRYILRNRPAYYRRLDATRKTGDWKPWILWTEYGRPPSGSPTPSHAKRTPVNEPSRETAKQNPAQAPATTRSGSSAAGSAAGPLIWSTHGWRRDQRQHEQRCGESPARESSGNGRATRRRCSSTPRSSSCGPTGRHLCSANNGSASCQVYVNHS